MQDIQRLDALCFRLSITELARERHRLRLLADHSIMDARSVSLVFRDLFRYYSSPNDRATTEDGSGTEYPWSFGRWTAWERMHVERRGQALHSFWRQKLAGLGPFPDIQLPTVGQSRRASIQPVVFDLHLRDEALAAVSRMATTRDISEFSIVSLLLKATVLAVRMASSSEISCVVPAFGAFPNRLPRDVLESVGGFANSAIIASELQARDTLTAAATREAQEIFVSSCHQDLPHALITKALEPRLYGIRYWGSLDQIPHYLNLDMPSAMDASLNTPQGLRLSAVLPAPELPRSGLRMIAKRDATWTIEVRYDPHVYSEDLMELFRAFWTTITESWLRHPESPLESVLKLTLRSSTPDVSSPPGA